MKIFSTLNGVRILFCGAAVINFLAVDASPQPTPRAMDLKPMTIAESSDFKSTSTSAEVVDFIDACTRQSRFVKKFVFGKTVEGRDLVGVTVADDYYELGATDQRNVILLLGNIHSGECAGKEALLMLVRELTQNRHPGWLEQNVIVFVPNYNADANDRMGLLNRPGQIGPIHGMGRRENAQELDLNRDFGKLESPEARSLVALIDRINPHVFVDCHTTNGSQHQYALTYDIPHNPTTAEPIRDYLREIMMPAVSQSVEKQGLKTFYYGNFNDEHTTWQSFGHEPRYSTEYVGLRGRFAILLEAYSYIGYQERIFATKDFLTAILDFATDNHNSIRDILDSVDSYLIQMADAQPERIAISLGAKATAFPEKFTVKGFKDQLPFDYQCDFVGNYIATKSTTLPYAYLVPQEFARVADRLMMHGIVVKRLVDPRQTDVEIDTIAELQFQTTKFQKHLLARAETTRQLEQRRLHYGDYLVQTDQPLGRLASYLLEAESDDGLVCWNFFDDALEIGAEYPVWRLPDPLELRTEKVNEVEKFAQIQLEQIDGPQALLHSGSDLPKWLGNTNLLKTKIENREVLIDASTCAFVERRPLPFETVALQQALVAANVPTEAALELSIADPLLADNGSYAVVSNAEQAFLYFVPGSVTDSSSNEETAKVLELGTGSNAAIRASDQSHGANLDANIDSDAEDETRTSRCELFEFNHDQSQLAYVTTAGLHILDLATRIERLVESDDEKRLLGKLDWVYQEELYGRGNFKAFWWNPRGDQIAFLSLDESPVIPFTVMDHLPIRGKSEVTNYPKAGDPLPNVKVGVARPERPDGVTWVDLSQYGDQDFLVSRVTWSHDGDVLLLQIQNREQTWLDLVATDRNGENARVLFRDETPAWIESPGDPAFVSATEFLWLSPRDGYNRIYKYSLAGELLTTLTTEDWEVRQLLGIDTDQTFAYFTGSENDIDLHAYRLNLSSGAITKLTSLRGNHQVDFSNDFSLFLDHFSTVNQPTETLVCRNDGQVLRHVNVRSDDRWEYLKIRPPEFLSIPARDGTLLDAMVIKPPVFSQFQKHPVLMVIYAGPRAPRVRNRFDDRNYLWHQMLAQQGYVVWLCDNRSASFRSAKNAWPIHKNLGLHELADINDGVDWLKRQPWADESRIGLSGWSYGGYMTLFGMTHTDSFRMGIAGAPVTDWKNYDAIYTERYMGLPAVNAEGYAAASVLNKASQLHGKLLLVHGEIDDNVHLNNSIQLIKELQDAGKQFDMMLYPSSRHSVQAKKQAAHLRKLMTDFIVENL